MKNLKKTSYKSKKISQLVREGENLTNLENRIDIQFCDVVDACVSEKNSQLDEKVSKLSVKDRKTVYDVLDLLIRDMTR